MEDYLTIGEVSKITHLPISTLRYFDAEGILSPHYKDEETNYRYYKLYQIPVLRMIIHLKNLGINNQDIKQYLEDLSYSHILEIIKEVQERTEKEIERLKSLKEDLLKKEEEIKFLEGLEEKTDTFYLEEKELSGIYYELSNENPYKSITKAMKKMDTFLTAQDGDGLQTGVFAFIIPQDNIESKSYSFSKLVALRNFENYPNHYKVEKKKYLCLVCIGEFESIGKNIEKALKWIEKENYTLSGDTLVNIITGPYLRKNPYESMYILKLPVK